MRTVSIVVEAIESGFANVEGGRTITITGQTHGREPAHCVLTFPTAADVDRLRAALEPSMTA